ncbi:hypothetical protein [Rhodococcus opacus]|nr:hypothetical protein [Rhodococcus opacus]
MRILIVHALIAVVTTLVARPCSTLTHAPNPVTPRQQSIWQ